MANEISYSIIIPHKNIPDLLRRCLNSIPRRDDIQIIVVDDNSDPEKVDFKHFPGTGEKCVEVYFTKEGKGAGFARNIGLKHAKGKWVLFADADDFFEKDFVASLDKYSMSNLDVIYFNSRDVDADSLKELNVNRYIQQYFLGRLSKKMLPFYIVVPWSKMISRGFLLENNIVFEEICVSNDVLFSYQVGCNSTEVKVSSDIIYNYLLKRLGSLTSNPSEEVFVSRFITMIRGNVYLRENGFSFFTFSPIPRILSARKYSLHRFIWCLHYAYRNRVLLCGLRKEIYRIICGKRV